VVRGVSGLRPVVARLGVGNPLPIWGLWCNGTGATRSREIVEIQGMRDKAI